MDFLDVLLIMGLTLVISGYIMQETGSSGFEFVNPVWLYHHFRVNWVGLILLTILFNAVSMPYSIGYWIYKLCTYGRK